METAEFTGLAADINTNQSSCYILHFRPDSITTWNLYVHFKYEGPCLL